jgi:hypothetical protein
MNDSYPAAFALKHLVKDLGLAKDGTCFTTHLSFYDSYVKAQEEVWEVRMSCGYFERSKKYLQKKIKMKVKLNETMFLARCEY